MKNYCATLLAMFALLPESISSSQCNLEEFQSCMKGSSSPSQCASSSGCESTVTEFFSNINVMKEPVIFRYSTNPNVEMSNTEVDFTTLDHSEFRESSSTHFPLSRPFTVTRTAKAGKHNTSLMMPTFFSDSTLCASKHMNLISLTDRVPGAYPGAKVETCQTMLLTSICLCFVNMFTESGSFIVASSSKHPLSIDSSDTDLRRRLDEKAEDTNTQSAGDSVKVEDEGSELDVDFITHTALVILTVVAFIGNGFFLTYVFCVSAV
jgi:hypothetical protein